MEGGWTALPLGTVSVVVDNIWVRPDGSLRTGQPEADISAAYLPHWMLRAEGWAFVSRTRDAVLVEFDPRCVGTATVIGMLDAVRTVEAGQALRVVEVRHHEADRVVSWCTAYPLNACRRILRIQEIAQSRDNARYLLHQRVALPVETLRLDPGRDAALLLPRIRAFAEHCGSSRVLHELIQRLGDTCKHVSIFRLEDGDPRVVRLGGALLFGAANAEGARLADILPASQVPESRDRILTALQSDQPALRRHRSAMYDAVALTMPFTDASGRYAVTMSQPGPGPDTTEQRSSAALCADDGHYPSTLSSTAHGRDGRRRLGEM